MAAIFKNAIKGSVSKGGVANEEFVTIYTAPMGKTSYIIECDIACIGNTGVQISVRVKTSEGEEAHIVKSAPVPVGSAIQVIDGQKIVLEPGDSIEAKCDTDGQSVDVIISLVEDVNS